MLTTLDSKIKSYVLNKNNRNPKFLGSGGMQYIIDEMEVEVGRLLPHGSGIDSEWRIEHREDTTFCCHNSFHAMDVNGMYCGYVGFMVVFDALTKEFVVEVSAEDIKFIYADYEEEGGEESNAPYLDDLDEYLYQTLDASLEYYCVQESIKFIRDSRCYVSLLNN